MVFNGNTFSTLLLDGLKQRVRSLSFIPEFSDILVGTDGPSARYVRMKEKVAEEIGVHFVSAELSEDVTTEDVLEKITELSSRSNMCGIIVQLPLPNHIDTAQVLNAVPIFLDVDGLSQEYSDLFYSTHSFDDMLIMPTVSAVRKIIREATDLDGKHIAVVGQGRLVGRPITHLLKAESGLVETIDIQLMLMYEKTFSGMLILLLVLLVFLVVLRGMISSRALLLLMREHLKLKMYCLEILISTVFVMLPALLHQLREEWGQ